MKQDAIEQFERNLLLPRQNWLLGAGASKDAGIPLMTLLTKCVAEQLEGKPEASGIVNAALAELPDQCHIEHILSHLGDYAALAERSRNKKVAINGVEVTLGEIESAHQDIARIIVETIRWGCIDDDSGVQRGSYQAPLVTIAGHLHFVDALFKKAHAGLHERRGPINLFTTNYDTLLEDALALRCINYWDGFSGGAVAFRSHRYGQQEPDAGFRARVIKLHGSIDWHLGDDGNLWRIRGTDAYPDTKGRVLIYPQATKYVATQRDPFAAQFDIFRRSLSIKEDNVLVVCGYSFGDGHINQEIESCIGQPEAKSTLVAFSFEGEQLAECLDNWRHSPWGNRVYIATEKGLYIGDKMVLDSLPENPMGWWKLSGVTALLENGVNL